MSDQHLTDKQKDTIRRIQKRQAKQNRTGEVTEKKETRSNEKIFDSLNSISTSDDVSNAKRKSNNSKKIIFVFILIIIFFIVFLNIILKIFFPILNVKTGNCYGGKDDEWASSLVQTIDGGYALSGVTASYGSGLEDAWFVKLDNEGEKQWDKTFGGNNLDWATSIIQTTDGGYAFAGRTKSYSSGMEDAWIVRLDCEGNKLWEKAYGDSGWDVAYSIIEDQEGVFVVVGATQSDHTSDIDAWLVKIDSKGDQLMQKKFGGREMDAVYSIINTNEDGYALVGSTKSYGTGEENAYILNLDSDGNINWEKAFGENEENVAHEIIQTNDGGYALAGYTSSHGAGGKDFWLVKLDQLGNKEWENYYGGYKDDVANSLIQTIDGNYYLAGYTESFGKGAKDCYFVKVNNHGKKLSSNIFGGSEDEEVHSLIQNTDGGYAIAGNTRSKEYNANLADFLFLKIEPVTLNLLLKFLVNYLV